MASTTAIAVKSELFDRFTARAADEADVLAGVLVTWDRPVEALQRETLYLMDVSQSEEWAALGARHKEETYTLEVRVICEASFFDDPQTLSTRAAAIWDAIATELREDPSLDCLTGLVAAAVEGFRLSAPSNSVESWRQAVIDGRINVVART